MQGVPWFLVCIILAILHGATALFAQSDMGELRVVVIDPSGLPALSSVELVSEANQIRRQLDTDAGGSLILKRLPYGIYHLRVDHAGFAPASDLIEIRSAVPKEYRVTLQVAAVNTEVIVTDEQTLLDPHADTTVNRIDSSTFQDRVTALPGRSLINLVDTQPGWLLEANGVLHPRGSEYQTQYVLDGIPLTENRSPAFSPELDADEVQTMAVLTGGYPAEYGRKLGGVIQVDTARDSRPGLHGKATVFGGSFDTFGGDLSGQYGWARNTLTLSGNVSRTDRYLDPPVEQNFTNAGTNSTFAAHYERDWTDRDRVSFIVRQGTSRFQVPNEQIQEQAGQRQDRGSDETAGQVSYQHIFSPEVIGSVRAMVRDLSATLWTNPFGTPILAAQDRGFREVYVNGSVSGHSGIHEWKVGVETDFASVREAFSYQITEPVQFDPGTPPSFEFSDRRQDREQALFAQDMVGLGHWTFSAGLRWDHYRFLVDENAFSPRLAASWSWPAAGLVLHASYDRVFQTPAFENLLLSSSPAVGALNNQVLRLPVRPSLGNFYEAGFAKILFSRLKLDANYYRRTMNHFPDDDLLLNTGVNFPVSFQRADTQGVEVKLGMPHWGPLSGYVSYSNMLGWGYLPITGGLLLGDNTSELSSTNRFPNTQDQRNSVRSRFLFQPHPRLWVAADASYGSGLPVEFDGTYEDALAQYGQRIVDRVNFERGRVRPSFSLGASAGILLRTKDKHNIRLQADVQNLTNRLNVIDFAGAFSGTALGPPRSVSLRLQAEF